MTPPDARHPEQRARQQIDAMLAAAGWAVQDRKELNLAAAPGVAVREFWTHSGPADYLLFLHNQLVGVLEAKKAGVTLSSVEAQTREYAAKAWTTLQVPVRPLTPRAISRIVLVHAGYPRSRGDASMNTVKFSRRTSAILILAGLAGCQEDVITMTTDSATDAADLITSGTSESEPTGGEPTTGGIDPLELCRLDPGAEFEGSNHVCSGHARGGIIFDYYGDPEGPLGKYLKCFQKEKPQPEGYIYTCSLEVIDIEFAPDVYEPFGHQIDACCLEDSPLEAVAPFCRIDAAEEFCLAGSEQLNALRQEIPVLPSLTEINLQLANLNKFMATSETQTECAQTYAKGLASETDFENELAVVWKIPDNLDIESGWPWLRNIITGLDIFTIDASESSGISCSQVDDDALQGGELMGGKLQISGIVGETVTAVTGGRFSFRRPECPRDSCPFHLESLDVKFVDFAVGPLEFSDVSVSLDAPVDGVTHDSRRIGLPAGRMHLSARFRLAARREPVLGGALLSVGLTNHGEVEAQLQPGPRLAVHRLEVVGWPFVMTLASGLAE